LLFRLDITNFLLFVVKYVRENYMFGSNKRAGPPEIRVVFIKPVEPSIKNSKKTT
jgi:hypothetical protein